MPLKIGDRKKFLCRPGVLGNKLAVQIVKKLEDIEQAEFEELATGRGGRSMSDGSLSQDEIDALLQETDNLEIDTGGGLEGLLGEKERGAFLRLLEGLVGAQASNLSILTRKSVNLDKPTLQVVSGEDLSASLPAELVDVKIDFSEGLRGEHTYLLDLGTAQAIAGLMMGQAGVEMDDAALSAVAEALSQMSGPVASEIGNQISRTVKTAPPDFQRASRDQARFPQGEAIVKVEYPILVEGQAPSRLTELYSLALVKEIAGSLPSAGQPAAAAGLAASFAQGGRAQGAAPAAARGFNAPPSGAGMTFGQSFGSAGNPAVPPNVQPVQFANLQAGGLPAERATSACSWTCSWRSPWSWAARGSSSRRSWGSAKARSSSWTSWPASRWTSWSTTSSSPRARSW